jgi:hypothetical protein
MQDDSTDCITARRKFGYMIMSIIKCPCSNGCINGDYRDIGREDTKMNRLVMDVGVKQMRKMALKNQLAQ